MYFLHNCNHEKRFTGRIFLIFLCVFFASCQKLNFYLILLKKNLIMKNLGHFMTDFRQKCHFCRKLAIKWPKFLIIKFSISNIRSKLSFWHDAKTASKNIKKCDPWIFFRDCNCAKIIFRVMANFVQKFHYFGHKMSIC